MRLALVGDAIAGHALVRPAGGGVHVRGYVAPGFRGRGIATELCAWAFAATDAREVYMNASPRDPEDVAFVEGLGFTHVRTFFWMVHPSFRDVPEPAWPDGITVRSDLRGAELIEAWADAYDRSFVDHWDFHPADRDELRHHVASGRPIVAVAHADGEVAGHCACWIEDVRGVVGELGTCRGHRGVGLGKALLLHGIRSLAAAGVDEVAIGVDSENPSGALGLYERVGFVVRWENRVYRRTMQP